MTKKAYISGPISGFPNGNYDNFELAEIHLKELGFEVVNPHKIHSEETNAKNNWIEFMKEDIKAMVDCTHIFILDMYELSKGARIEMFVADSLGLELWRIRFSPSKFIIEGNPDYADYKYSDSLKQFVEVQTFKHEMSLIYTSSTWSKGDENFLQTAKKEMDAAKES